VAPCLPDNYKNNRKAVFSLYASDIYQCETISEDDPLNSICTLSSTLVTTGVYLGYCYDFSNCQGHCSSTLSQINITSNQAIAVNSICNIGYTPPNPGGCYQLCTRMDPISNMCLDEWFNTNQNGLTTGGSQCSIWRQFRFYGIGDQGIATYSPYHYNVQFTILLPSGVYSDLISINNETCPFVSLSPDSNFQLWLNIQNNEIVPTTVYVSFAPLNNTHGSSCDVASVCCNLPGTLVTVNPRNTYRFLISACPFGSMSINVSMVTNVLSPFSESNLCFQGQGQSLLLAYQTAASVSTQNNGIYTYDVVQVTQNQIQLLVQKQAYEALETYVNAHFLTTQTQIANLNALIIAEADNVILVAQLQTQLATQQIRLDNLTILLNYTATQFASFQEQLFNIQVMTFSADLSWKIDTDTYATAIGDLLTANVVIDGQIEDLMVVIRDDLQLANDTNNYIIELGLEVLALNAENDILVQTALQEFIDIEDKRISGAINAALILENSNACGCGFIESINPFSGSDCSISNWITCAIASFLPWLITAGVLLLLWCCWPQISSCCSGTVKGVKQIRDDAKKRTEDADRENEETSRNQRNSTYSVVPTIEDHHIHHHRGHSRPIRR
jgi:hypothetical protein